MDSSRNEEIYRRNNKASRILQMIFYFLVIFSVICPTDWSAYLFDYGLLNNCLYRFDTAFLCRLFKKRRVGQSHFSFLKCGVLQKQTYNQSTGDFFRKVSGFF